MDLSIDGLTAIVNLLAGESGIIALLTIVIFALVWKNRKLEAEKVVLQETIMGRLEEAEKRSWELLKESREYRRSERHGQDFLS